MRYFILLLAVLGLSLCAALAHDLPISFIDLQIKDGSIEATIEASARNFAHDLPGIEEGALLQQASAEKQKARLLGILISGLSITTDGRTLTPELRGIEPLPEFKDVRLRVHFGGTPADRIEVRCSLFSFDPGHKIFLNIYEGAVLRHQGIFASDARQLDYSLGEHQETFAIVTQFIGEGVHHIFIGPDHILFIVGLLLLGGGLRQLLKIVTAFTIAHSITLVLATLNVFSPPARLVEPAIALSIVFVGVHALLWRKTQRDWRLLFALCFGFIHGFGFAGVLRQMELPAHALGWSLFSFNMGVEVGQACIVLTITPVLSLLHRRSALIGARVVTASSLAVVLAGGYWLVERIWLTN